MTAESLRPWPITQAEQFNNNDEGGLNLGQALRAIRRQAHLIIGITILVASGAFLKAKLAQPSYQAKAELLTQPVSLETKVISSTSPQTLSNQKDIVGVTVDEAKLKILRSPRVMSSIVQQLQAKYPNINYNSVVGPLNLEINQTGEILTVSYQDRDAHRVKDVLNTVVQAYLKYSLKVRQSDVYQGIMFLEQQLPQLRSRAETLQRQLQRLRQKNNLIDPTNQAQHLSLQLNSFVQERLTVQEQLSETRLLYLNLQKEAAKHPLDLVTTSVLENARYQELLNQILAIDTQMAKDSVLLLEGSPEIQLLQEQRQRLVPLLIREGRRVQKQMANQIQEMEIRAQALDQTISFLKQQIQHLSITTRYYNEIQQELEIANNNLNQFIVKREALRIDAAQKQIPWELLTPPSQPEASSVSVKQHLLLGIILGLLIGTGIALALDKLSNILHSAKEVKDISQLLLLGVIPLNRAVTEANLTGNIDSNPQPNDNFQLSDESESGLFIASPFSEAFHSLYSSIRLLSPDTPIRSLVISSAMPKEGKSTVAVNLGQAAAATGRRVLLVDTDLRSPYLHRQARVGNWLGLTDIISRDNLDFNNLLQRSPIENNLFVLTTGPIPPDPIRLLGSEKMQNLIRKLHDSFDLVIYDAPSLIGLADAQLLAAQTNGIVLVAGLGMLKRSMLERALEQLKTSRTPILGVVANKDRDVVHSLYNRYQEDKRLYLALGRELR